MKKLVLALLIAHILPLFAKSQNVIKNQAILSKAGSVKSPFEAYLSKNGENYLKFGLNTQLWARYTELNPGSMIGSNQVNQAFDFVIRRVRLQMMGLLFNKVFLHIQVGTNNVDFTQTPNAPISILDMLGEYRFSNHIHIGLGLSGWGAGTTRYSAQSSSTQLTLDSPIYQQNNISSVFGNRNLSAYAKGNIGDFAYRLAITNPYKQSINNLSTISSISTKKGKMQMLGMLTYQILDKELVDEPYNKATYLGSKRILNIAAGYMYQPKAMWRLNEKVLNDTILSAMKVFGIDLFYDTPINKKGAAITLYVAYNNCDYGKNYTRMIATPNPVSSGSGSGFVGIGTGNIFYTQFGFLFNKNKKEEREGRIQIYSAAEIASLEALKTPMSMFELGFNYYITGKLASKITLGYQSRSVFSSTQGQTKLVETDRKGMLTLQYQISF